MSLRQQAKILGISPTYLSLMINGKRKWQPEIKARYDNLVTTLPNNGDKTSKSEPVGMGGNARHLGAKDIMVGGIRVELMTSAMSTQRSKPLS